MTFRARRYPLIFAAVGAAIFWLFGGLLLFLMTITADAAILVLPALFMLPFAIWFTIITLQIWRLRAVVSANDLELTAHAGARVWIAGGLKSARIPWGDVQGIQIVELPMQEPNYILFTKQGDFTINGTQFENVSQLAGEIASRSGRELGAPAEGREAAIEQVTKSTSGARMFLRVCGWVALAMGALISLAVLGIAAGGGDKIEAAKVGVIAVMMFGIAARLIRTK